MPSMTQLREFAPTTGRASTPPRHPVFDHVDEVETMTYLDLGSDNHRSPTWTDKGTAHLWLAWTPSRLSNLARSMGK